MDALFTEYAHPFSLLDGVIATGRLCEFIDVFQKQKIRRERWDFYINKMALSDMTWEEFNKNCDAQSVSIQAATPEQLESTVTNSLSMLNEFQPEERGEK